MVLSATAASPSAPAKRALSLYRSLLRAARSLPARQDRESLEEETKRRFRAEREKEEEEGEKGGGGGRGGGREEVSLAALLDEAEARLHDARHHGIPFARLEHAAQIPRAVLESARELFKGGRDGEGEGVRLPKDRSARAKLEAAVERRRLKRQLEEERQNKSTDD